MQPKRIEDVFAGLSQKTMKWNTYFDVYDELLAGFVGQPITLVEVGVLNGGSLTMWREYLGGQARIIGIDNNPNARRMEVQGFEIFVGDQASPEFWADVFAKVGSIDVLIDDGGHTNRQQVVTLSSSLAHIRDGGLVITEDTHTSYMPHFGNPSPYNFVGFAKHIADAIQARSPLVDLPETTAFAQAVHSVGFYESMVVLKVDRTRCRRARHIEVGDEHIEAVDHRHADSAVVRVLNRLDGAAARLPSGALQAGARRVVKSLRGRSERVAMWWETQQLRSYFRFDGAQRG